MFCRTTRSRTLGLLCNIYSRDQTQNAGELTFHHPFRGVQDDVSVRHLHGQLLSLWLKRFLSLLWNLLPVFVGEARLMLWHHSDDAPPPCVDVAPVRTAAPQAGRQAGRQGWRLDAVGAAADADAAAVLSW